MTIIMDRNTSPISPFSAQDFQRAFEKTQPNQYPFTEISRFKEAYSKYSGFPVEEMELANGSDEWLQKLMITLGQDGVLALSPDFGMYQVYAKQIGVDFTQVESDENFDFEISRILLAIESLQPSLFILSNPQNPTSTQFSEADLQVLADAMAGIGGYLVIDEAYVEFASDYTPPAGDHVILVRTMSKIYGMAGLRIGIIKASNETYQKLISINHPYPVNNLNLNLAADFLEDERRVREFLNYQRNSRDKLLKAFAKVGHLVNIKESATNFVFTYGDLAIDLANHLKQAGFQGRVYSEENLAQAARYSIIELEDYEALNQALENWRVKHD